MYNILKALLEAQSRNGEDGKDLVDGAIMAIREFIFAECNQPKLENELKRVAKLLTDGE